MGNVLHRKVSVLIVLVYIDQIITSWVIFLSVVYSRMADFEDKREIMSKIAVKRIIEKEDNVIIIVICHKDFFDYTLLN